jgi:hypothetical protein
MSKNPIIKLIVFLFLPLIFLKAELTVESSNGKMTLDWELDPSRVSTFSEDLVKDGWTSLDVNGFWTSAYIQTFSGDLKNITVQTELIKEHKNTGNLTFRPAFEQSTGFEEVVSESREKRDIPSFFSLNKLPGGGFSLTFIPVIPLSENEFRFVSQYRVTLSDPAGKMGEYRESPRVKKPALRKSAGSITDGPYINVRFSEAGMICITGEMLSEAGVVLRNMKPDMIQVWHQGIELPARINARSPSRLYKEDKILVWVDSLANPYGNYRHNPHSPYDVLQIVWNRAKGLRYAEESGEVTGNVDFQPESFTDVVHLERAERWDKLSQVDQDLLTELTDHWFFGNQIIAGTSDTFHIRLDHPKQNSERQVKVNLRFQGITYGSADHQVTILLNNRFVSVDSWAGQKEKFISSEGQNFSHGHLQNGNNVLTVVMSGDPTIDRLYDMVMLDWVKIEYDRYFRAAGDRIQFKPPSETGPGTYLYELNGFSGPDVMIIKNNRFWVRDYVVFYDSKYRGYTVLFQDESLDGKESYSAVGADGIVSADTVIYRDPALMGPFHEQGDYIIISHPDFLEELSDFLDLQRSRGFSPVVVDVTRIYDHYSWGNQSPYAIRRFLKDAWENWSIQPRYALLVGDAGKTGRSTYKEGMFIPTQFFQTYRYGACVTDTWYGDINDDMYQEIIVGRLPVRNAEQVHNAVNKFRTWHEKPVISEWLNRMVMIAGYEDEFKIQTETAISEYIPASVQVDRLYINPSAETGPFFGTTATLSDMINAGKPVINFRGHGGGAVWADRSLFTLDDVETLENEEKPCIITSFTCFTAAFETEQGLGEGLTRLPGGSVAFLGSSGLGWVVNDYLMLQAIYQYMFKEGLSFGKAVQLGKLLYTTTTGWRTHAKTGFYQYNILGDPSVVLPFDYKTGNLAIQPPDASPGDQIVITLPEYAAESAMLDLTFRGSLDKKQPVIQRIPFKPGADSRINLTIPDTITAETGDLTVFFWNENAGTYCAGHAPLSFGASLIYEPYFPDGIPEIGNRSPFYVKVKDSQGVDSVMVQWNNGNIELLDPIGNDVYTSNDILWDNGSGKRFRIRVIDGNKNQTESQWFLLKPLPGTDLRIYSVEATEKGLRISAGSTVNDQIQAKLTCTLNTNTVVTDTLTLIKGVQYLFPSVNLPFGTVPLEMSMYPIHYIETDSSNNAWTGTLTNTWIKANHSGISGYPGGLDLDHELFSNINVITDNSKESFAGIFTRDTVLDLTAYGGYPDTFSAILLNGFSDNVQYSITLNPGVTDTTRIPAVFNPENQRLMKLVKTSSGYRGFDPGYLLFVKPSDYQPPSIEITVNSRNILSGSFVSDGARFSALITDNILVHADPSTWGIYIDGEELDRDLINVNQDKNGRRLGLNFNPEFTLGKNHILSVSASDGMGNLTESPGYELITTTGARILDYGCFPNPFGARTYIIYELTSQFDEVIIEIFTVSGRRILRIDRTNAETDLPLNDVGYHEIPWYGRDQDGEFVANGVYFYKILGKISAETYSSRGKVVKLR